MSDFEKTYTLVQQTPLIHFQHDEDGATLRATEVKPKLDRFLLKRLEAEGINPPDCWFVKHDPKKGALDYKMRIEAEGELIPTQIKDYKFYFGNTGNKAKETENTGNNAKETVFYREHILTVVCFHRELMEKIDGCIEDFFILHNFGTRQTKGFGGFLVSKRGDEPIVYDAHRIETAFGCLPYLKFSAPRTKQDERNLPPDKTAFDDALTVYGVMKGGFNQTGYNVDLGEYGYKYNKATKKCDKFPGAAEHEKIKGRYIKGFIQREYLPGDTGSDKSYIKQYVRTVFPGHERPAGVSREPNHEYSKYRFVRVLLGLADHYEFRDDMRTDHGEKREVNIYHYVNVTEHNQYVNVTELNQLNANSKKGIERFASPILIKIFDRGSKGYEVYFLFRDSWQEILGKTFILVRTENVRSVSEQELPLTLKRIGKIIRVPDSFDPKDFLTRFIAYYDQNKATLRDKFPDPYNLGADITLEGGNLNA